jgi:hypothetical protein
VADAQARDVGQGVVRSGAHAVIIPVADSRQQACATWARVET